MLPVMGEKDRRKYPRVQAGSGQTLVLLRGDRLVGEVVDISMGGFAMYYSAEQPSLLERRQPAVLIGRDDLWLTGFPVRTVSDAIVRVPVFAGGRCVRRRGMQFAGLSNEQRCLLRQYIWLNGGQLVTPSS